MDNSNSVKYSRELIKGKIAEAIFEEMFRVVGEYTILPLGYEHTTPMLAQYQHLVHVQKVLENIRNAPDFALISQDKRNVFLVEVKYKSELRKVEIFNDAKELYDAWNPCFLFVASENGFYYGSVHDIVIQNGEIHKLPEIRIVQSVQLEYLKLLKDFIK